MYSLVSRILLALCFLSVLYAGSAVAQQSVPTQSSLVNEARKYIGGNPTGRKTLWCGAFLDFVLKRAGYKGGGNLASAYVRYPGKRVNRPVVGAIAVMARKGGGHVGIVSGVDVKGNPVIISGNTWNRSSNERRVVLERVYPQARVYAYVLPQ